MKKRKSILIAAVTFIFTMIICLMAILFIELNKYRHLRDRVEYITQSQASEMKLAVDGMILNARILELFVVENSGDISNFDLIASKIYDDSKIIRSIQLAPNGVITCVYPIKGNEEAMGDLFSDNLRKQEIIYAMEKKVMTLSGPYALYQGGEGLVARLPIFLADENGQDVFWGFSIVVLNCPEVFEPAQLDNFINEGFEYKLWKIDQKTGHRMGIMQSSDRAFTNPVEMSFQIADSTWYFSVMPENEWFNANIVGLEIFIAVVISFFIGFLIFLLIYINEQRRIMRNLSYLDSLTGLSNHRRLTKIMEETEKNFGLIYMDFDKFKQVNDTYGHGVGDEFLLQMAKRIKSCIGDKDEAFRIGGDEFACVIFENPTGEHCDEICEKINRSVERQLIIGNARLYPSVSCGYSIYPDYSSNIDDIFKIADQSMYKVKNNKNSRKSDI
ncbi:MAG: sensor domain-containing diguanylate cyclase [Oscillospiraceae bacterium]